MKYTFFISAIVLMAATLQVCAIGNETIYSNSVSKKIGVALGVGSHSDTHASDNIRHEFQIKSNKGYMEYEFTASDTSHKLVKLEYQTEFKTEKYCEPVWPFTCHDEPIDIEVWNWRTLEWNKLWNNQHHTSDQNHTWEDTSTDYLSEEGHLKIRYYYDDWNTPFYSRVWLDYQHFIYYFDTTQPGDYPSELLIEELHCDSVAGKVGVTELAGDYTVTHESDDIYHNFRISSRKGYIDYSFISPNTGCKIEKLEYITEFKTERYCEPVWPFTCHDEPIDIKIWNWRISDWENLSDDIHHTLEQEHPYTLNISPWDYMNGNTGEIKVRYYYDAWATPHYSMLWIDYQGVTIWLNDSQPSLSPKEPHHEEIYANSKEKVGVVVEVNDYLETHLSDNSYHEFQIKSDKGYMEYEFTASDTSHKLVKLEYQTEFKTEKYCEPVWPFACHDEPIDIEVWNWRTLMWDKLWDNRYHTSEYVHTWETSSTDYLSKEGYLKIRYYYDAWNTPFYSKVWLDYQHLMFYFDTTLPGDYPSEPLIEELHCDSVTGKVGVTELAGDYTDTNESDDIYHNFKISSRRGYIDYSFISPNTGCNIEKLEYTTEFKTEKYCEPVWPFTCHDEPIDIKIWNWRISDWENLSDDIHHTLEQEHPYTLNISPWDYMNGNTGEIKVRYYYDAWATPHYSMLWIDYQGVTIWLNDSQPSLSPKEPHHEEIYADSEKKVGVVAVVNDYSETIISDNIYHEFKIQGRNGSMEYAFTASDTSHKLVKLEYQTEFKTEKYCEPVWPFACHDEPIDIEVWNWRTLMWDKLWDNRYHTSEYVYTWETSSTDYLSEEGHLRVRYFYDYWSTPYYSKVWLDYQHLMFYFDTTLPGNYPSEVPCENHFNSSSADLRVGVTSEVGDHTKARVSDNVNHNIKISSNRGYQIYQFQTGIKTTKHTSETDRLYPDSVPRKVGVISETGGHIDTSKSDLNPQKYHSFTIHSRRGYMLYDFKTGVKTNNSALGGGEIHSDSVVDKSVPPPNEFGTTHVDTHVSDSNYHHFKISTDRGYLVYNFKTGVVTNKSFMELDKEFSDSVETNVGASETKTHSETHVSDDDYHDLHISSRYGYLVYDFKTGIVTNKSTRELDKEFSDSVETNIGASETKTHNETYVSDNDYHGSKIKSRRGYLVYNFKTGIETNKSFREGDKIYANSVINRIGVVSESGDHVNTGSSDNSYHQFKINLNQGCLEYEFKTGQDPDNVERIFYETEFKTERYCEPVWPFACYDEPIDIEVWNWDTSTWDKLWGGCHHTSEYAYTWDSGDSLNYLNASGDVRIRYLYNDLGTPHYSNVSIDYQHVQVWTKVDSNVSDPDIENIQYQTEFKTERYCEPVWPFACHDEPIDIEVWNWRTLKWDKLWDNLAHTSEYVYTWDNNSLDYLSASGDVRVRYYYDAWATPHYSDVSIDYQHVQVWTKTESNVSDPDIVKMQYQTEFKTERYCEPVWPFACHDEPIDIEVWNWRTLKWDKLWDNLAHTSEYVYTWDNNSLDYLSASGDVRVRYYYDAWATPHYSDVSIDYQHVQVWTKTESNVSDPDIVKMQYQTEFKTERYCEPVWPFACHDEPIDIEVWNWRTLKWDKLWDNLAHTSEYVYTWDNNSLDYLSASGDVRVRYYYDAWATPHYSDVSIDYQHVQVWTKTESNVSDPDIVKMQYQTEFKTERYCEPVWPFACYDEPITIEVWNWRTLKWAKLWDNVSHTYEYVHTWEVNPHAYLSADGDVRIRYLYDAWVTPHYSDVSIDYQHVQVWIGNDSSIFNPGIEKMQYQTEFKTEEYCDPVFPFTCHDEPIDIDVWNWETLEWDNLGNNIVHTSEQVHTFPWEAASTVIEDYLSTDGEVRIRYYYDAWATPHYSNVSIDFQELVIWWSCNYTVVAGNLTRPSFFDRLDGSMTQSLKYIDQTRRYFGGDPKLGMESLVSLYEFNATGLGTESDYSWVDYLYWSDQEGCRVYGTYPWLRIDAETAKEYCLDDLLYDCI